jgi:hypothetical protein
MTRHKLEIVMDYLRDYQRLRGYVIHCRLGNAIRLRRSNREGRPQTPEEFLWMALLPVLPGAAASREEGIPEPLHASRLYGRA